MEVELTELPEIKQKMEQSEEMESSSGSSSSESEDAKPGVKLESGPPPQGEVPHHISEAEGSFRRIFNNSTQDGTHKNSLSKFCKNAVHTTKYRWWSFIFKNLYEQFHRLANFYFLLAAVLTLVPQLTNLDPVTSLAPLIFVLGITALKEAYEDLKRASSDTEINNRICSALRNGEWKDLFWKDIQVGDILKIPNNSELPFDILILNSNLVSGLCYVQTANLDGETNLKIRQALQVTTTFTDAKHLSDWEGRIECENPNKDLYNFDGRIFMNERDAKPLSLNNTQVLLRGCILKNTEWIYGLVIFTGNDTKLRQNARNPPSKRSTLEKEMNTGLITLFVFLFVVSALCAGLYVAFRSDDFWFLAFGDGDKNGAKNFFFNFMSYHILYSYMIPISLYVSIELVKIAQIFFIEQDIRMYYEPMDQPAKAKTSNLNEELGQIDYLFSDKTGTLTSNEMELLRCSINGMMYSLTSSEDEPEEPDLHSKEVMKEHLNPPHQSSPFILEFFRLLSVCHAVIPEIDPKDNTKIVYQAASPDEYALVQRAAMLGFKFKDRTFDTVTVDVLGNEEQYRILNLIEFSSNRKRMSVICKTPSGKIRIYCKGADSVILPRLTKADLNDITQKHLEKFAGEGLRTLCCAYADLDEKYFDDWNKKFEAANNSLKDRKQLIEDVAEEIEQNFTLLGATAIEDKLQDGVPEAIADLRKANLKIWVLTGDKIETAINIGYSCSLLTETNLLQISQDLSSNEDAVMHEIKRALDEINNHKNKETAEFSLVVEGQALKHALSENVKLYFLELALKCKTVVCCRVSPAQKQSVVRVVKKHVPGARTAAIGDGANDVSMIQEADVGIGIFGKEGMQAAMSSDYAIAQFRYLRELVLVHGRWNYTRTSKLILYSFYKNIALCFCLFWFQVFSLYSAENFFDSYSLSGFNMVFAATPILAFAIFNQDIKARSVLNHPQLYESGQKNQEFGIKLLWWWIAVGLYNSVVIFFGIYLWFEEGVLTRNGVIYSQWAMGHTAYTCVVIAITAKMAIETDYWTVFNWICIFGSVILWFLYSIAYSNICWFSQLDCYVLNDLWATPTYWLVIIVIPVACILPDVLYKYMQRNLFFKNYQIVQEIQFKERKERRKKRRMGQRQAITALNSDKPIQTRSHTGFAFAVEDGIADALRLTLSSLGKKRQEVDLKDLDVSIDVSPKVERNRSMTDESDQSTSPRRTKKEKKSKKRRAKKDSLIVAEEHL